MCLPLRSCLPAVRPLLFLLCLCALLKCELLQVLSARTLETLVLCAVYTSLLFWNSNVTVPAKCQPVAALPPQDSQFPKGDGDTVRARVMLSSAWPVRNIWKSFCKLTSHYATHSFHSIVGFWAWSVLLWAHLHSFNMFPCTVETSLQQKPRQSPAGQWNGREMRIDIWFMFTSFGPIDREDIFISMFVKAFHKKRNPFSRLINMAVRRFYF